MSGHAVRGTVAAGFEHVRRQFAAVVAAEATGLDVQMAAYHRGELVVDLWAGAQTEEDSLFGIYSVSKGVTHLIVALLVQDGVLDLDERVSYYWPEFGVGGKRDVLLRELLSHQAGIVGTVTGFSIEELADDQAVAERLGAQRPWWRPAAASGYHALVMGAVSGEVVYRATGHTVQTLFTTLLRDRLNLDLHLGLPAEQDCRFVPAEPMLTTPERLRKLAAVDSAPNSLSGIAFNRQHPGSREVWELPNIPAVRAQGPASFGGVGTARALAKLFSVAVGTTEGVPALLTPETADEFAQIQIAGWDLVLRQHKAWAVGFHPVSELYPVLGAGAFGHSGAGGQQALVDPRNELSYAFLRRRFCYPPSADVDHARILGALVQAASGEVELSA